MTNADKAPLEVIAASLRRERRRTGLSLTEVARRRRSRRSEAAMTSSGAFSDWEFVI